ncbi:MAG: 50S ribosomal protein L21 [Chitinophagales bacterium]
MYAIVETGGKQYRVTEGDIISVEKLGAAPGQQVILDQVVLVGDGDRVTVGKPHVDGVKVVGTVVAEGKSKKVLVFRYKAKQNVRRKRGHRQPFTRVRVEKIEA